MKNFQSKLLVNNLHKLNIKANVHIICKRINITIDCMYDCRLY